MRIEWGGIPVELTAAGDQGRGVLLLHGWMCSAQMMESVQRTLSPQMRVFAPDFPGHGQNGKAPEPPVPWGVEEYAELCRAIILQYDLAPCDIVAHSFGARVAIYLASEWPELVGRMVLTGAAGLRREATDKESARRKTYRVLRDCLNAMEKVKIFGTLPARGKEALVQRFGSPDYRALDPLMRQSFNRIIGLDLAPRLEKVRASTLLFWGANDTETPLWMGQKMEQAMPDAGLVVEENAGHFAYLEKNAVFLTIIRHFLLEGRNE